MMKDIIEGIGALRRIVKNDYPDSKRQKIDKAILQSELLNIIDDKKRSREDKMKANEILGCLRKM